MLILPLIVLLVLAIADVGIFALMSRQVLVVRNTAPAANFSDMLWRVRWLDILGQLAIIVVGVFAILGLFRKEGLMTGAKSDTGVSGSDETHGS